ncbi:MAG: hypothetical protein SFX73_18140 [Kofleriaceae bacterium]|nr:hypothetical protein [Kofleriaceae bacterium]
MIAVCRDPSQERVALICVAGSTLRWCFSLWLVPVGSEADFLRIMRSLEKQDFEDEVCGFLQRCITDFQTVPANPHGDAGLDGHSHGQTVAYCCYGPEEATKSHAGKLKAAIVNKFRDDLRKLFELDTQGSGKAAKLVHCETAEMKTILAAGKKIGTVRLVVSVFDSHQILAPLNEAFSDYLKASKCRYVAKKATMTIWGPKQLALNGAVDDLVIARLQQREIVLRVANTLSKPTPLITPTSDFDEKFDWIAAQKKGQPDSVARLRDWFRKQWSKAVAVENDFANNAPNLHSALAQAREEATSDADLVSGTTSTPQALLIVMREKLAQRLEQHLGARFPADLRSKLVDGEIARLIGECPVDWRST